MTAAIIAGAPQPGGREPPPPGLSRRRMAQSGLGSAVPVLPYTAVPVLLCAALYTCSDCGIALDTKRGFDVHEDTGMHRQCVGED